MKSILKFAVALFCLQLITLSSFAQSGKNAFIGVWELVQAKASEQPLQNSSPGYLKIFNTDGTFTNIQALGTAAIISHSGKYKVTNDKFYMERPLSKRTGFDFVPLNTDIKIDYEFNADKTLFTAHLTVAGNAFTEIWRKL